MTNLMLWFSLMLYQYIHSSSLVQGAPCNITPQLYAAALLINIPCCYNHAKFLTAINEIHIVKQDVYKPPHNYWLTGWFLACQMNINNLFISNQCADIEHNVSTDAPFNKICWLFLLVLCSMRHNNMHIKFVSIYFDICSYINHKILLFHNLHFFIVGMFYLYVF